MTDSTTISLQCTECARSANAGASWFWLNGWGPLCGICYFKITGVKIAPSSQAVHEGHEDTRGPQAIAGAGMTDQARSLFLRLENDFGVCGCTEAELLRGTLVRFMRWCDPKEWRPMYSDLYGEAGVFYLVAGAFERLGLIEHGTSVRFPWLTEAGKKLLDQLESIGDEIESWDEGEE